jgi:hypothetical protein
VNSWDVAEGILMAFGIIVLGAMVAKYFWIILSVLLVLAIPTLILYALHPPFRRWLW